MHDPQTLLLVAKLHAENIREGFLPTLGLRFLCLMYWAIDRSCCSVLLVERDAYGTPVGFVAGSMGMRAVYRQMLLAFPRLLYALLPSFVSPFKMFRMLEILLHARRSEAAVGWPSYELLSIAVDPSSRGRGVSDRLYMGLVDHCRSSGIASFRIVVGAGLDSAHRFYSRMGAEVVGNVQVHGGQDSLVYVQITAEGA